MMKYEDLKNLTLALAKADVNKPVAYSFDGVNYSYSDLQETLRTEFNELAGDYNKYRKNYVTLFQLMEEAIDEVLPKMVLDRYMDFADVKTFKQGQNIVFTVPMGAVGGAAQVGLEEFLDGHVDFSELFTIILEGMDEAIYAEVGKALQAMVANFGVYNKFATNGFNEAKFDQVLATAEAYGPTTIYCTYEFAATMVPSEGWVSDEHRNERWQNGFIANYKGHKVVVLPQSLTEDNSEKIIDPSWAYMFPGDTKPVKLAFEGQTIVDEFKNADRSREIQAYKKFGIATVATNAMAAYQNTSLVKSNALQ